MARRLLESDSLTTTAAPLEIDREKGIIKGVRVLGAESRNRHGERGVDGTDYSPSAHADARKLYEGMAVLVDHNRDTTKHRSARDPFGTLRNVREGKDDKGRVVTEADIHYYSSHGLANIVLEDIEKKMGNYGLSHDAAVNREHVDRTRRRLVIEGIETVRSVDLVFRPASNRNLWESTEEPPVKKIAFRALLEQLMAGFDKPKTGKPQPNKAAWTRRLLEDDGMLGDTGPLAAEVEADDPEDAIEDAFCAAVTAIVRGEGTADEKLGKIELLLEAQEAIAGDGDAAEPPGEPEKKDPPMDKKEQLDERDAELARLRGEKAVRQLCEQEEFTPNDLQVETLTLMTDAKKRRRLIEQFKAADKATTPKSGRGGSNDMPTGDAFVGRLFGR